MAKQSLLHNYYYLNQFLSAVSSNRIVNYVNKFGPYIAPTRIVVQDNNNYCAFSLSLDETQKLFCENSNINNILVGSSVSINKLTRYCKRILSKEEWENIKNNNSGCKLEILQGISIEGNKDSKVGKIQLYATNSFKKTRHRYSFVSVQISDATQPAQILCLLKYSCHFTKTISYYAIIRYLMPVNQIPNIINNILSSTESPFKLYEWEWNYHIDRRRRVRGPIITSIINIDTIVGTAFVIPVYTNTSNIPDCQDPRYEDRFWFSEHIFFDRSGWEEIHVDAQVYDNNDINNDKYTIYMNDILNVIENNVNNDIDSYSEDSNSVDYNKSDDSNDDK
jgi:hypothetical protein